ncbi:MAG: 3-deoxy-manno-octulosonate cytidylyltransferase [Rickettsiales bacterium]|jgi:3-deoxy-manno-octulosonate cytidylyltransferase (CMP-KDO synthetase)|nr:3-deoxy-manno-octulosonate cytidylyltransferase [Rickettsiales bacterium]
MAKVVIVIPARYASSRFPGKPLAEICGKPMLRRTYDVAIMSSRRADCEVIVATEDARIMDFCKSENIRCVMTSDSCKTGTDRVCETVRKLGYKPELIINLQGDAPLTPPWFLTRMMADFFGSAAGNSHTMVTPGTVMSWEELDKLRENKKTTPFTGTTLTMNHRTSEAIWFSKNIIPAIRDEKKLRETSKLSPVIRHVGLYGYGYEILMEFATLKEGYYEKLEGLEQLRIIENGYKIKVALVDYRGRPSSPGVDTPEDIKRAEASIAEFGEFREEDYDY